MSYIEQVARDALQAAYTELAKARRTLLPVAGVLALIHLLTVYPYLEASREIAAIETTMAANTGLLAALEPEIAKLQEASASAEAQLTTLLKGVTAEMVGSFAGLRSLVASAVEGERQVPELLPGPAASSPMQQMPMQQMPMQMQAPPEPMQMQMQVPPPEPMQMQMQVPPPERMQMQVPAANLPLDPAAYPPLGSAGPFVASPELQDVLAALAAGEPAWERLIAYARRDIVEAAYARAERDWSRHIRPAYLSALEASTASARRVAGQAPESAAQTAAALYAAADAMAEQRAVLETIQISHDNVVDEALGTDWWHTVQGKSAYADAVTQSVADQMDAILQTAKAPSEAIGATLALQEELRAALVLRQEELEQQFAEQREQLAALSGTAGVVPIDLASFIGLFPLALGLVLAFMLWRVGQARHQGAQAAADLGRAAPEDRDVRIWLTRRVLSGGDGLTPSLATGALAAGALLWIGFAAWQIAQSPSDPPLAPWTSGTLAALVVLVAAAWDLAAIRHLAAQLSG